MSTAYKEYDITEQIHDLHERLVNTFQSGKTKDVAWRKWQLKQLWWMLEDNQKELMAAMKLDLNRSSIESMITDFAGARKDILYHLQHIDRWASDEPLGDTFIARYLGLAHIRKEPLGVVLIIGAWNFPLLLVLQPLIAAIAAGCCAIIKPSELIPNSQGLLKQLIPKYLDESAIGLVCGGVPETTLLLGLRFHHIFFTGSAPVGRIVSAAAAKHMTPVTLELGGQCPAIICRSADIDRAAKCVAYSKFLNSGQICLSVNHIFVDPTIYDKFTERLKYWINEFLDGQPTIDTAIVNQNHFDRLLNLIHDTDGRIFCGGSGNPETRRMEPTVILDVDINDSIMKEEIFGPICPVLKGDFRSAYNATKLKGQPLAIYIFSNDKREVEEILENSNSGGVTVNDVILHAGTSGAPFGGVGSSGHGYYHGPYGFNSFTHLRTIMNAPSWLERALRFRYPPFNATETPKALKLKANFKRGEGIDDQRRKSSSAIVDIRCDINAEM
ncbi:succinate semialdehyde dehydrogenase, putative [Talaromyces stipitatus ATCC 10500]|uniref:Aldehyde dehydrogenase n=1 Tax=Talaromyces stipitatus (strain ATCC 10500 / CBS 375.48 / QM 6759 / NRRL 1006) TaxID=441959 RepID=B8MPK1_TALSN|nr:succinate semialdehyde dehydrogenase, putative [Talaromyces stipitatus ATCC 10500]EED14440.1 succinate semialdehyde dehydrogenase, putative [Talaromyces stipitatus ATCC 10500]